MVEIGVNQSEHACLVAPVICARSARRKDFRFCGTPALRRLVFGGFSRLGLLGEFGLGDPAGNDASLHDHALGIVARDLVGVENAGVLGWFAAFLALSPADQ